MKRLLFVFLLLFCLPVQASLVIEITRGVDNPTSIAIAPFGWSGSGLIDEDIAAIVSADLHRSGQFAPVERQNMMAYPRSRDEVVYRDWRISGVQYLLIGNIHPRADKPGYEVFFELYDVLSQRQVFSKVARGGSGTLRDLAHFISDTVYEQLTGFRGAFSTRIIFVRSERVAGKAIYQLWMADADGAREQLLRESAQPLMSPSWSPNGREIAYVSFEDGRKPAIYRQILSTGQREKLTAFDGLNSAPAWSPDGSKLAMVLSRDGDPEIYIMDIASRKLQRITRHFAIDTEPCWMPDGKSLLFTSNRGGQPQIYQVFLDSLSTQRVSFEGDYNARPVVTSDGKQVIMVHRRDGDFHIALLELASGRMHILTDTALDESPTLAPNDRMLMYAAKQGDKGILAAVSIDGGVKVKLPAQSGDVREPAWSPFFH